MPPATGIVHQVNLEYLAKGVVLRGRDGEPVAFPDTLVGTDSHTTMINGLGVLGWGVGGIEAEAAMLGQPLYMLTPAGGRLQAHRDACARARPPPTSSSPSRRCCARRAWSTSSSSSSAPGSPQMTLADRATIANMAPEYGATMRLLPGGRRDAALPAAAPAAARPRWSWSSATARSRASSAPRRRPTPSFTDTLELDLGTVEPSLAGPKRPQDRVPLRADEGVVPQAARARP